MKQTFVILSCIIVLACSNQPTQDKATIKLNEEMFVATMQKHLDAVSNKDLVALKETMAPNGQMTLLLPASEKIDSVSGFMDYHEEWFKHPNWTFETKILETEIGQDLGIAIIEIIYREPERDGVPYFNRMFVSYALKKFDNQWSIIKDHASSIEKSTDKN